MSEGILIINIVGPILYFLATRLKYGKKGDYIFLLLSFLHITIFYSCFKYDTLPDISWYNDYFYYLKTNTVSSLISTYDLNYEYGFYYFEQYCSYIFDDVRSFYVIRGIIVAGCNLYFIKKYSPYSYLLGVLFFFMIVGGEQSVFVVRQYLAMSIFLMAIDSIVRHNQIAYLFWTLLAISFHNSTFVFLPLYYLYWINIDKKKYYRIIIIACVAAFVLKSVSLYIFSSIGLYQAYTLFGDEEGQVSSGPFMRSLALLLPYMYFCKYKYLNETNGRLIFWFLLCNAFISFVIIGVPTGDRMYRNFSELSIIAVPYIASKISKKSVRSLYLLSMVLLFAILYFNTGYSYGYYFIWE